MGPSHSTGAALPLSFLEGLAAKTQRLRARVRPPNRDGKEGRCARAFDASLSRSDRRMDKPVSRSRPFWGLRQTIL